MRDPGPTYDHVDDIMCRYAGFGRRSRRRMVAKVVLENRGGWATIMFAFQDLKDDTYQPVRYAITRWQRLAGQWHRDTGINLRPDTATAASAVFAGWDPEQLAQLPAAE